MVKVKSLKNDSELSVIMAAIAGSQKAYVGAKQWAEAIMTLESKVSATRTKQSSIQTRRQLRRLAQQVLGKDQKQFAVDGLIGDGGVPPSRV